MQESCLSKPPSKVTDFVSQDAEANTRELRSGSFTRSAESGSFWFLSFFEHRELLGVI